MQPLPPSAPPLPPGALRPHVPPPPRPLRQLGGSDAAVGVSEAAEEGRVGQGEAEGEGPPPRGGTLGAGEGEEEEYETARSSSPALTGSTASIASAAGPEAADGQGRPAPEGVAVVKEAGASSKELPAAQPQQKGSGQEGGAPDFAAATAGGNRREQPAWRIPPGGRLLEGAECQQQREPPPSPAEPSSPPNSQPLLSSTLGPSGASAGAGAALPDWLLRSEHTEVGARKVAAAQQAALLPASPGQQDSSAGAGSGQAQQAELERAPRPGHAGAPAAASALVLESTELAPAAAAAAAEAVEAALAAEQAGELHLLHRQHDIDPHLRLAAVAVLSRPSSGPGSPAAASSPRSPGAASRAPGSPLAGRGLQRLFSPRDREPISPLPRTAGSLWQPHKEPQRAAGAAAELPASIVGQQQQLQPAEIQAMGPSGSSQALPAGLAASPRALHSRESSWEEAGAWGLPGPAGLPAAPAGQKSPAPEAVPLLAAWRRAAGDQARAPSFGRPAGAATMLPPHRCAMRAVVQTEGLFDRAAPSRHMHHSTSWCQLRASAAYCSLAPPHSVSCWMALES